MSKNKKKSTSNFIKILLVLVLLAGIGAAGYYAWQTLFGNRDLELLDYSPQEIKLINEHELKDSFVSAGHSEVMLYAFENDENAIDHYEYYLIPDGSLNPEYRTDYIYANIQQFREAGYSANETLNILRTLDDAALRFISGQKKPASLDVFIKAYDSKYSPEDCYILANSPATVYEAVFSGNMPIENLQILLGKNYNAEEVGIIMSKLKAEDFSLVFGMKYIPELPQLADSGQEFRIDLLPRYLLMMRKQGKSAAEAMETVNAGKDVIPANQVNYSALYIANPTKIANPSDITAMVNKENYLPSDYEPADLVYLPGGYYGNNHPMRSMAADAFVKMADAVVKAGYGAIIAQSNYRDYNHQSRLYEMYKSQDGQAKADTYSARPGFSEHQTGLVTDISARGGSMDYFANYGGYKWVMEHAHEFGFIQRYPDGKEYITGYEYESWHFRYVGVEVATVIHQHGWTLEEYKMVYE
ncbi:MAG: M15 family metallopeptidase [Erysipelotrichaceae bacterium]|nr:M15 family metallopeptidase [Erysipelotrichaceae bacterium]